MKHAARQGLLGFACITLGASLAFIVLYLVAPGKLEPLAPAIRGASSVRSAGLAEVISVPVLLRIENINVSAVVYPVGLTGGGDMDIRSSPDELAWYRYGPAPGNEGSAVIAGHYGWKDGRPAVFNDLEKLVAGDEVVVQTESEQKLTFVVTRTAVYSPEADATSVFTSDDGRAYLNLITCRGEWDTNLDTYSQRFVVFTEIVEDDSIRS